jgi:hypothetical protein
VNDSVEPVETTDYSHTARSLRWQIAEALAAGEHRTVLVLAQALQSVETELGVAAEA